jgi:hypothetical protein
MPVRNVGKWLCAAFIAWTTASTVVSCGGSGNGSVFTDGGAGADSSSGGQNDATTGDDGPRLLGDDGGESGAGCTPKTCAELGYNCGQAVTCGSIILDCGGDAGNNYGCPAGEVCGGGGSNVCGSGNGDGGSSDGGPSCTPKTCLSQGYNCGYATDGCGNVINCNPNDANTGCTAPAYCGGGGYNVCGTGTDGGGSGCTSKTCAQLGYNCGAADDGCGNVIQCGTCTAPQYCGGGGYDLCGPTSIATCSGGGSTTLTGFVYDPANSLPIYNALVYVPVGNVQTPTTGIDTASPACGCSAPPAYASAYTSISGAFTLTNLPSGAAVTVVVQLGKWQRVFTQNVTSCQANTASNGTYGSHLTLPSTHLEGNIPLFAVDTGGVDSMECVLSKMGIATSEFVDPAVVGGVPTAAGRVHFYEGSIVAGGAIIDANTPKENALTETASVMDSYDVLLFPCQGDAGSYTAANGWPNTRSNLITYTNDGGRMFATHFHYDLLDGNGTFSGTANWTPNAGSWGNYYTDPKYNADIDQTFATGATLAAWLNQPVVYGGTAGVIPVGVIRNDFSSVNAPAQRWLYTAGGGGGPAKNLPIHYTFDTPFNQSPTCGRVVYSDFHVESQQNANEYTGVTFPGECPGGATGAMTPQEKLLEFMLFDLTSCVSPPVCVPLTCSQLPPGSCGPQGDGCGNTIQCPACPPPDAGSCTPETCAQQNVFCGNTGDGCGNVIQCGTCTPPQTCGGGGVAGHCGAPDAGSCTPKSCAQQGIQCGVASDGCGNILTCPNCPNGESCNTTTGQCQQNSQ